MAAWCSWKTSSTSAVLEDTVCKWVRGPDKNAISLQLATAVQNQRAEPSTASLKSHFRSKHCISRTLMQSIHPEALWACFFFCFFLNGSFNRANQSLRASWAAYGGTGRARGWTAPGKREVSWCRTMRGSWEDSSIPKHLETIPFK